MDNYEFNALPIGEQANTTWDQGTFLLSIKKGDCSVNLYWLEKFFVEVYYDKQQQRITRIRSFKTSSQLQPYLRKIDI
jgi:hypothetical protein